jgi:adenylate cyclase class IV
MKKFSEFYFEKFNENVPNTISDAEKDDYFQEKNKFRGSKSRVEGGHPEVTLQMDKTNGSLHIWMGKQNIDLKNGKFVATTLKKRMMRPDAEKESDVVVRDPNSVDKILNNLNDDDLWWVKKGHLLYTTEIPHADLKSI